MLLAESSLTCKGSKSSRVISCVFLQAWTVDAPFPRPFGNTITVAKLLASCHETRCVNVPNKGKTGCV
jgi:hypothetical protein